MNERNQNGIRRRENRRVWSRRLKKRENGHRRQQTREDLKKGLYAL
jgi:hypothetical protein